MTFEERKNNFVLELNALLKKYKVALGVNIQPVNWIAKLLKRQVKVNWSFIVTDMEIPEIKPQNSPEAPEAPQPMQDNKVE
ncbi:MAG: hypothetical protein Athens071426_408 [Parcubacteria group bacterium Athens0714_26]|nr:MAG: hypothetical protein Athens071426_408 [Parcubacteria group bacterium Athens0714_26]